MRAADAVPTMSARIDRLPATRYVWRLVALISFGAFFEIYDLLLSAPLSLGLLAAGIFHDGTAGLFGLSDQASFVAATFAGLYVGTLLFSFVADRFGRRPIFTIALLWYALATIAMGLQRTAPAIDAWRFVASLGVGLELVAIDCYLAELMPKAHRGRAFAISAAIQFLSAPMVGLLAWLLIPGEQLGIAGWRWLAFVPAIGAVLIWRVRRALPESPRWLEAHGRAAEAAKAMAAIEDRVAADLGGSLPPVTATDPQAAHDDKAASLWRPPYRRRTLTLIAFHIFQTIGYYGFSNWLPTLLVSQGITIGKSLGYTAVVMLLAPMTPFLCGWFADRVERKWTVVAGALLAAACGLLLSRMTRDSDFLIFTLIGGGVAIGNAVMSFAYHGYQSELFPTRIRARGVGFVYSFSRLSAIFTSYVIAFVLKQAGSTGVFILISSALIAVSLIIGLFGPRTRGLALEEI